MKKFKNHTLDEYVNILSKRTSVPGGGSVAALSGALACGLVLMVAEYSIKKDTLKAKVNRIKSIIKQVSVIKKRFVELVDLDAQVYLKVVKSFKGTEKQKKDSLKQAKNVCLEISKLCYKSVKLMPYLVENGNKNLISDLLVASELFLASYNSSQILSKENN